MKWIKKNIIKIIGIVVIIFVILLYLLFLFDDSAYSHIKRAFKIDLTSCKIVKSKDTHGGFHGDGILFAIFDCSKNDNSILSQINEWKNLPITNESLLHLFDGMEYHDFYKNEMKEYNILNIQNGFYRFKGKNRYDEASEHEHYGNYNIAIYDLDNSVLYYFEFDS